MEDLLSPPPVSLDLLPLLSPLEHLTGPLGDPLHTLREDVDSLNCCRLGVMYQVQRGARMVAIIQIERRIPRGLRWAVIDNEFNHW